MSELEKYTKSIHERNIIRNFLDYANKHNYFLCCEEGEQQSPELLMLDTIETEGLLDGYFGIDSDELDNERREIRKRREEKKMNFNEYSILMCIALSIYSVISIAEAWGSIL